MRYLKTYEDFSPVEYVAPQQDHLSYKNVIKRRKKKKTKELEPVMVPPNHTRDVISFKRSS